MFSNRFFRRAFPYLIVCGCLAAAGSTPSTTGPTLEESSAWLEAPWNLRVVRGRVSQAADMAPSTSARLAPPLALCRVAALPEIQDPEALAFEKGTRPAGAVDVHGLMPALARALARFQRLVISAGGYV